MPDITLSLSSSFEDVPKEVSHFLSFVSQELEVVAKKANHAASALNVENAEDNSMLEFMHHIRQHLVRIDTRMEDCMAIWAGYIELLANPPSAEDSEESEEPAEQETQESENDKG